MQGTVVRLNYNVLVSLYKFNFGSNSSLDIIGTLAVCVHVCRYSLNQVSMPRVDVTPMYPMCLVCAAY